MLSRLNVVNADAHRRYLLDKTQHLIGGFGKGVNEPPGMRTDEQTTSLNI